MSSGTSSLGPSTPATMPAATGGDPEALSRREFWVELFVERLGAVNRELWLLLTMFVIALLLNSLITMHQMVLGFYVFPTLFSAYFYGRRHATLTALGSILVVFLLAYFNPLMFRLDQESAVAGAKWFDIAAWGGSLLLIAYTMGSLYEHKEAHLRELRRTYYGVLMILQQFISKDKYTQNHSYRVSIYATKIAASLTLPAEQIEDIRAAALLHDIGKLDISRALLYKAARLTSEEYAAVQEHVETGVTLLQPVGGTLGRIIPIILAHHDKFDGTGHHATSGEKIPVEARILSVADVYDALTSDRPYRKAMSPFEAKEVIRQGAGTDFDPRVVEAFLTVFNRGQMEVPEYLV
jgi:putative nucleotidyltransferase with HDIG domain